MAGYPFWAHWGGIGMVIVILAAIAIAIVAIVRTGRSNRVEHGAAEARGLDILAERFARGEVDAETYRSMKAELEAKS
ncbi:MAG: electron transporter RnfE [Spirochaetae bacterium HGW-Spirochaetae-3]|nr:MAG: electron transporter RnfE [Spirochaetae bacterium HGW-Spirochaetae-3]